MLMHPILMVSTLIMAIVITVGVLGALAMYHLGRR
jgi:hypothetical protein